MPVSYARWGDLEPYMSIEELLRIKEKKKPDIGYEEITCEDWASRKSMVSLLSDQIGSAKSSFQKAHSKKCKEGKWTCVNGDKARNQRIKSE